MAEQQELMFEILQKIQSDIGSLREGQHDMRNDINNLHSVNTRISDRLTRIENRLELRELAEAQARFEPHP